MTLSSDDEQIAWTPRETAPSIGFYVWHLAAGPNTARARATQYNLTFAMTHMHWRQRA
jgi:hypothetical protein